MDKAHFHKLDRNYKNRSGEWRSYLEGAARRVWKPVVHDLEETAMQLSVDMIGLNRRIGVD